VAGPPPRPAVSVLLFPFGAAVHSPGSGHSNALDPAGPGAQELADLWWILLLLGGIVFVVVSAALLAILLRARRARRRGVDLREAGGGERWPIIAGGIVVPAAILLVVMAMTVAPGGSPYAPLGREFRAGDEVPDPPRGGGEGEPIRIRVEGRRFWWDVRYLDDGFVTANEIRIPVGRDVRVDVTTGDVIHSFWVPSLGPKIDMINGKTNVLQLRADRPGEYLGKCAEYCGVQHALMEFRVVAEPPERYAAWVEGQRAGRAPAADGTPQARGERVFANAGCAACHRIAGTGARGVLGPDLTKLATRRTLAAGTIPNTRGHLGGWIVDPQSVKPGNLMPPTKVGGEDLQALLDYLESLR
jgi:cytochrome c oxidase subunit II